MKISKKAIWILLLLIIFVSQYKVIVSWASDFFVTSLSQSRALPKEGIYSCETSNTKMHFTNHEVLLVYENGIVESLNIDFGNNTFGESSPLIASIHWNQDNEVQLKIKTGNDYLKENQIYMFSLEN